MTWEVRDRVVHDTSGAFGAGDVSDRPCPTITVGGQQVNACHFQTERRRSNVPEAYRPSPLAVPGRPPYRVPTMAQIRKIRPNGYTAASFFSGCGGSSLGYKLAGFDLRYAAEFIPAAQDTYRANFPATFLDVRDIRKIRPEEVLRALSLREGELDCLDGSPPCASFSTSGKRESGWGAVKPYSDTHQRTDDLFFEYARMIRGIRPRAFVAENVAGLIIGAARGMFLEFLAELRACGYRVSARLLDAQWLGVPQVRRRIIFVGVRDDVADPSGAPVLPAHPRPLPWRYAVRDAIPFSRPESPGETFPEDPHPQAPLPLPWEDLEAVSIAKFAIGDAWEETPVGGQSERFFNLVRPDPDSPSGTITALGGTPSAAGVCHPLSKRKFTLGELRRVCSFPDDFAFTGTYEQAWERMGRAVPPVMMAHVAAAVRDEVLRRADGLPPLRAPR